LRLVRTARTPRSFGASGTCGADCGLRLRVRQHWRVEHAEEPARKGVTGQRRVLKAEPQERQRDGTSPRGFGRS